MEDMTRTLDMLEWVRTLYGAVGVMPGMTEVRLWRIEKYLVWRLERVGVTVPTAWQLDQEPERDRCPIDEYDYLTELFDIGEAGC